MNRHTTFLITVLLLTGCPKPTPTSQIDPAPQEPTAIDDTEEDPGDEEEHNPREIWAGSNGVIVLEAIRADGSELLGALSVVDFEPTTQGHAMAADMNMDPGQEKWDWVPNAAWPTEPFYLHANPNVYVDAEQTDWFTHTLFPAQTSPVQIPSTPPSDRFYRMEREGGPMPGLVGWLWVQIDPATGEAQGLTWLKDPAANAALIHVGNSEKLHFTPANATELPAQAYIISQQPQ